MSRGVPPKHIHTPRLHTVHTKVSQWHVWWCCRPVDLSKHDVWTTCPKEFLNDEAVNTYLGILAQFTQAHEGTTGKCRIFDSFKLHQRSTNKATGFFAGLALESDGHFKVTLAV